MSKPRTGAPKRVAVGLLAGALAVFGVALAPPAGAAANVTNERLAGATRYGTAAAIAGDEAFATPTMAIVATGENFPDALAASSLAGANAAAPIILTQTGSYTAEAKAGMDALKAKGVTNATIVGGTAAVSDAVEEAIKADGFTVTRVAGEDRYETAAAIATAANTKSPAAAIGGLKPGLFATGLNFPDALTGGPAAYANKIPLLLVNDTVPAETQNAIASIGIKKAYVLGGTAAVSSAVEAQLVQATGNPVTRLAGVNRYSTAAAIGDFEITTLAFPATSAVLATGTNFPDALAAGPLGGQLKAPIVLTSSLPEESRAFLDKHSDKIQKLYVAGGTSAIDDATVAAAEAAAENVSNDSAGKAVTSRPELTGAAVVRTVTASQVTATQQAGTYVRFTFDEALGTGFGANFGLFHVYDTSNTRFSGGAAGTGSAFEAPPTGTTGTTSVVVNFTGVTTEAAAATLTKATVQFEAVRDTGGAGNPEGAAPIGTAGSTTSAAGVTTAPDLVSVGRFGQANVSNRTAVDFTFDQAATVASTTGFHLVDVNNNVIDCTASTSASDTGGGTIPGGSGTTTITATCANIGGGTTLLNASTVARGYVERGAVQSATGVLNPVQAADVAGNTTGPDLVSVAATPSASTSRTTAVFTFDQNIASASSNGFFLYLSDGSSVATLGAGTVCNTTTTQGDGTTNTCTVNSSNPTQVRVVFNGNLTNVVGGYVGSTTSVVGAGTGPAVTAVGGAQNQVDEEGATGAASTTRTPGRTVGPDLTGVALATFTDAFGNTSGYAATYTFDTTSAVTVQANGRFRLYMANGQAFEATNCVAGTGNAGSTPLGTVRCDTYRDILTLAAPSPASSLGAAVLGTVQFDAVTGSGGSNTEDAAATTGGTGTPAS